MTTEDLSFGTYIANARKRKELSQKELASKIVKEDDEAITAQYLNDIEHDRRSPSSEHLVHQFADRLGLDKDYLFYLAGKFPANLTRKKLPERAFSEAMVAFRKTVDKPKGK